MKQNGLAPILIVILIAAVAVLGGFLLYSQQPKKPTPPEPTIQPTSTTEKLTPSPTPISLKAASQVKERHENAIMKIPGVVGIGVGLSTDKRNPTIEIHVVSLTDEIRRLVPTELEGIPVKIIETGEIKAL